MANYIFLKLKRLHQLPSPSDFWRITLPPSEVVPPIFFFMKMTAKDVKEITLMPLITFFSVLERPGKNRKGVATTPLG